MELALVKLSFRRGGETHYFLDYVSYDLAKIDSVLIQGEGHKEGECSPAKIIKVFESSLK